MTNEKHREKRKQKLENITAQDIKKAGTCRN